jgi:hypothetical protein
MTTIRRVRHRPTAACRAGVVLAVAVVLGAGVVAQAVTATPAGAAPSHRVSSPDRPPRAKFQGVTAKHSPAISLDWAGYAVTGATITTVSGSWVQPAVACPDNKATESAFWVGIDGFAATDPTVQQIGTDSDCLKGSKKVPGGPSYYAWYEMYPGSIVVLPPTYALAAGDAMSASVTLVGGAYQLVLTDAGHWTFSTLQVPTTTPLDASAEWIVEAPTTCKGTKCKPVKLADFGSVGFTGASANGLPISSSAFQPDTISMSKNTKGTKVKASTSALGSGGDAFTVTWVTN